ncbi:MAG: hypothetical protein H6R07_2088 [Proteobacteria bacterium]|nr:hypothetical protein [Pseudomonadota bacterium]
MEIYQTPFGQIEVDPDTVITFPSGLPGFPDIKRYKLLHEERPDPQVLWLQALDDTDVYFSVVEADRLGLSYQITLNDDECAEIGLQSPEDVRLLLILARKENEVAGIAANAQSPIVLNLRTRKALQKSGLRADIVFRNV